jgi:cephalosporin hydroxylase
MGMDRNTVIGFVLIGMLLMGMFYFNSQENICETVLNKEIIKLNNMSIELESFYSEKKKLIEKNADNIYLQKAKNDFNIESNKAKYSYNFSWMGRPIIAYPQDMIAMQEIIWDIKPDLIIEAGIAHGGSLVYYASLLELIGGDGIVLGLDIDIRKHNRDLIESHSMSKRIKMIEGDSTSLVVANQVYEIARDKKRIIVCLDSNHTHDHVLSELNLYANLTTVGSYCIVFDTIVEELPEDYMPGGRPWNPGNNPKTAVFEFLKSNINFEIDKSIDNKILVSVAPDGYLKRMR